MGVNQSGDLHLHTRKVCGQFVFSEDLPITSAYRVFKGSEAPCSVPDAFSETEEEVTPAQVLFFVS